MPINLDISRLNDNNDNPDANWKLFPIKRGKRLLRNVLRLLYGTRGMICGGFARWLASPNPSPIPFNDIDIYCQTVADYDRTKAQLLAHGLKVEFETEIATTFQSYRLDWFRKYPIQLIKPIHEDKLVTYGTLKEVIGNFDFSVIRAGVVSQIEVLADCYFAEDEKNQVLRLQRISCPLAQSIRIAKYHKKGYRVPPNLYLEVLKEWDKLSTTEKKRAADSLEEIKLQNPFGQGKITTNNAWQAAEDYERVESTQSYYRHHRYRKSDEW